MLAFALKKLHQGLNHFFERRHHNSARRQAFKLQFVCVIYRPENTKGILILPPALIHTSLSSLVVLCWTHEVISVWLFICDCNNNFVEDDMW